jgi:N-methylhydantoinase A
MRADLAAGAVARLAETLALDPTVCAEGIVRVTDAQMAKALRVVSVERGQDPRRFDLVPFGGAGPLHQAALARELGCRRVLVPPHPGVLSALGLLAAPVTVDRAHSRLADTAGLSGDELGAGWDALGEEARAVLAEQAVEVAAERRSADLRYRGQAFELEVAAPEGPPDVAALVAAFHAAHAARYGYEQPEAAVELVTLRVRLEGPVPTIPLARLRGGGGVEEARLAVRDVVLDGQRLRADILDRTALGAGATLRGPAVVVGLDATCWVAPWQAGEVDEHGLLALEEVRA